MKKRIYCLLAIAIISMTLMACGDESKTATLMVENMSDGEMTGETAGNSQEIKWFDNEGNELIGAYSKILDNDYELITTDTVDHVWNEGEICIAEIKSDDIDDTLSKIGYCLLDLDDNGVEELIVCEVSYDGPSRILTLYTLNGQEPVLVVEGWIRDKYYVLNDYRIYNEGSGGADCHVSDVYHMSQDGMSLELEEGNTNYNMAEDYLSVCKALDLIMFPRL